jgi:predicted restriction endonuclease
VEKDNSAELYKQQMTGSRFYHQTQSIWKMGMQNKIKRLQVCTTGKEKIFNQQMDIYVCFYF